MSHLTFSLEDNADQLLAYNMPAEFYQSMFFGQPKKLYLNRYDHFQVE